MKNMLVTGGAARNGGQSPVPRLKIGYLHAYSLILLKKGMEWSQYE